MAGWSLVALGLLSVGVPLVVSFTFGSLAIAVPLLVTGLLVLAGFAWSRWLTLVVAATYGAGAWWVATTPLRGLRPPNGASPNLDPATLAAAAAITLAAGVLTVLVMAGQPRGRGGEATSSRAA